MGRRRASSTACASRRRTASPGASSDGPITANGSMGVHHAWGRTLKDVFQRYKALRGFRPALPERVRLPGPLGRGERRARARAELEARDRGVRARRVRRALQGVGRASLVHDHRAVPATRHVDGLGQLVLHVLGHEHRVHLALPEARPRARLALPGSPLERLVPPLRHLDLPARADRLLRGSERPVSLRALPAPRPGGREPGRLDDDAVDAAGERCRRGQAGRPLRAARGRSLGRRGPSGRDAARRSHGRTHGTAAPSWSTSATRARSTRSRPRARSSTASSRGRT